MNSSRRKNRGGNREPIIAARVAQGEGWKAGVIRLGLIRTYGFGKTRDEAIEAAKRVLGARKLRVAVLVVFAVALLFASSAVAGPLGRDRSKAVVSRVITPTMHEMVIDGKTVKVRLIGVASPGVFQMMGAGVRKGGGESATKGWHARARAAVEGVMPPGTSVILEYDPFKRTWRGKNDFLLAYVWLPGGKMLNERIIRDGMGEASASKSDRWRSDYVDLLRAAQKEARGAGRGFWAEVRPRAAK